MKTLYTNKSKKFFRKYFMFKSYKDKQDGFYDNKYYDDYEFNKNNIENTTNIGFAKKADRIVLFDKGYIKEKGTHGELIDQKGVYAEMYSNQEEWYINKNSAGVA